jgi:hypothetical protein
MDYEKMIEALEAEFRKTEMDAVARLNYLRGQIDLLKKLRDELPKNVDQAPTPA